MKTKLKMLKKFAKKHGLMCKKLKLKDRKPVDLKGMPQPLQFVDDCVFIFNEQDAVRLAVVNQLLRKNK